MKEPTMRHQRKTKQPTAQHPLQKLLMAQQGMDDIVPSFSVPLPDDQVFYIYGEIEEELDYVDMIHSIRYASPGQQIVIHIASPGGSLNVCLAVINAIRASAGEVITILDAEACSAAAMIWLSGHKKIIGSRHTYLMLHEAGWVAGAKTSEHARQVEIMKKVTNGLIEEIAGKLLTTAEMEDLNKGVDVYLSGTEITERCTVSPAEDGGEEVHS
jgi:ATP-dependent protease ClpP protease subunit